jgi:hypothetical protein
MKSVLLAVFAGLVLASVTSAADEDGLRVKTGITETVGSQHYAGTSVFARFSKDDFSVKPAYSQYHDDFSGGTYRTLSARGAYDTDRYGVGVKAGGTPDINGYSNTFFGADGSLELGPAEEDRKDEPHGELGGGLTHTTHREDIDASNRRLPSTVTLGQNDLNGWGAGEIKDNRLTLSLTKSVYDKNVANLQARGARVVMLAGLNQIVQGFPNASVNIEYEFEGIDHVTPFASYTHTTFVAGTPSSNAVKLGADAQVKAVGFGASYERYTQPTFPDRNFLALNGSLKF